MSDAVNVGGRPPIYEPNEANYKIVEDLCEQYFTHILGEFKEDEKQIGDTEDYEVERICVRAPRKPTVTGLALFLKFDSKSTLYDYAKKEGFSYPIKRALTMIEQFHEEATALGDKCTGNIFILKNFGWHDTVKQDITYKESLPPQIEFIDVDSDEV